MLETMNADLFAGCFIALLGLPWMGWLLWDCYKHEKD